MFLIASFLSGLVGIVVSHQLPSAAILLPLLTIPLYNQTRDQQQRLDW